MEAYKGRISVLTPKESFGIAVQVPIEAYKISLVKLYENVLALFY